MINSKVLKAQVLILFCLLFGLGGCASHSPQTSFYQLLPLEELGELNGAMPGHDFSVGVGPITIADYLKRPQIVTRQNSSQLKIEEFHRWAGLLEKDISAVLVVNLTDLIGSEKVVTYPWDQFAKPDFRVVYDIQRFDGTLGVDALLKVRWTVFDTAAGTAQKVFTNSYRETLADSGYATLVKAQSRLLAQLSRDIAAELIRQAQQAG